MLCTQYSSSALPECRGFESHPGQLYFPWKKGVVLGVVALPLPCDLVAVYMLLLTRKVLKTRWTLGKNNVMSYVKGSHCVVYAIDFVIQSLMNGVHIHTGVHCVRLTWSRCMS